MLSLQKHTILAKHNQCRRDLGRSESTMQTELGQPQSSLGLRSLEAQVTHLGSLTVGQGAHQRVGTWMYLSWRRNHYWAPYFTHIRKRNKSFVTKRFNGAKQNCDQVLQPHGGQDPEVSQEPPITQAQCSSTPDWKWPGCSVAGFQQAALPLTPRKDSPSRSGVESQSVHPEGQFWVERTQVSVHGYRRGVGGGRDKLGGWDSFILTNIYRL